MKRFEEQRLFGWGGRSPICKALLFANFRGLHNTQHNYENKVGPIRLEWLQIFLLFNGPCASHACGTTIRKPIDR